ncbi:MAG: hypothetical protein HYU64_01135 [Armatimonadetes bacterium]|nr:hypothetical protein [Armatimonadota bacterium]
MIDVRFFKPSLTLSEREQDVAVYRIDNTLPKESPQTPFRIPLNLWAYRILESFSRAAGQ